MIRELAAYEKLSDQVTATEADIARALFGSPPRAEAVIARADGEPVGFALFFHNFSPFRGRGFGRRLLIHLARIAVDRGCGRFEWSVLDWNAPAIAAYRRAGAVPLDEWTVYRLTGDALRRLAKEK